MWQGVALVGIAITAFNGATVISGGIKELNYLVLTVIHCTQVYAKSMLGMIRLTIASVQFSLLQLVFTIFLIGSMLPAHSLAQSTGNVQQAVDSSNDNADKINADSPPKSEQPAGKPLKATSDWDNFAPPQR